MISRKRTFILGIFIFLIPFLGLPSFWKTFLVSISGLLLVGFSIKLSVPKRNVRARLKKEKSTPVYVENFPPMPDRNVASVDGVRKVNTKTHNIEIE